MDKKRKILSKYQQYLIERRDEDPGIRGFSRYLSRSSSYIYNYFKNQDDLYSNFLILKLEELNQDLNIDHLIPFNRMMIFSLKFIEYIYANKVLLNGIPKDIQDGIFQEYLYTQYRQIFSDIQQQQQLTFKVDPSIVLDLIVYIIFGFITLNPDIDQKDATDKMKHSLINFLNIYFRGV